MLAEKLLPNLNNFWSISGTFILLYILNKFESLKVEEEVSVPLKDGLLFKPLRYKMEIGVI